MLHHGLSIRRRLLTRILRIESLEHRMLLNADITFAEAMPYQVGAPANDQTNVADVNLDGTLDIVTSGDESTVTILLGSSNGVFEVPRRTTVPSPRHAITGDFDGDGLTDLASTGGKPGVLRVALNLGGQGADWTGFGRAERISTNPIRFDGLTAGDFDSDGDLDIVVGTNDDRVVVFLNNGTLDEQWDGFADPVEYVHPNFDFPAGVSSGDMDNDGDVDLLVSNYASGDLSILLGTGDGQFAEPVNYPIGNRGLATLGVADLDEDGDLDIIAPHYVDSTFQFGTDQIAILRGEGDGTLSPVETISAPGTISTLIAQDLDGDGDLDVAAGFWNSKIIHVLASNGDATFEEQDSLLSAGRISGLAAADLDGDRRMDLVASHGFFDQSLSVHLNTTEFPSPPVLTPQLGDADMNGIFDQSDILLVLRAAKYLTGQPASFAEGDWTGDGIFDQLDIIAAIAAGTYVNMSHATHRDSPHGGGGKTAETARSATMAFATGLNVKDDDFTDSNGDVGVYTDGLDRVMAQVSNGSRLDTTNGSMKIIDNNTIRTLVFDVANFALIQGEEISTLPDDGDGDTIITAGVDARVQNETDIDGNSSATKPGLTSMAPGDTAYAAYSFSFAFLNGAGVEERWRLAFAQVSGLSSPEGYGLPVFITAGADRTGDGLADYWTITGTKAGLTRMKLGNKEAPKYYGEAEMSFEITVEAQ